MADPITLALTGDSIIMQRLQVYKEPAFTRLFDLIRGADAAFTNLETLFHDYEMPPAHESGGMSNSIFQNETVLRMPEDSYEARRSP